MNKYIKWGIIAVVLIILYNFFIGTYNSLVGKEAEIEGKWANVEAQYQRRTDLIPSLVVTVRGYANHEQETLIGVVMERAKSQSVTLNAEDLTDENIAKFQAAQQELSQGIGRLMAIGESYPELQASRNFINLQDELAGTENRITKVRTEFNDAVKEYNAYLKKFPRNILSGMYGFEKKAYFEAAEGSSVAPTIEF